MGTGWWHLELSLEWASRITIQAFIAQYSAFYPPSVLSVSNSACPEALPARFAWQRASQLYLLHHTAYALAKYTYVVGSGPRCIARPLWLLLLAAAAALSPRPLPSPSNSLLTEQRCAWAVIVTPRCQRCIWSQQEQGATAPNGCGPSAKVLADPRACGQAAADVHLHQH